MAFELPCYIAPDFSQPPLEGAPYAKTAAVTRDGVAPEGFHATSVFPEYFMVEGRWQLAEQSRANCVVVVAQNQLRVIEPRYLLPGDMVVLGRTRNAEEGIYVHTTGFSLPYTSPTPMHIADYGPLCRLLLHERKQGNIVWVVGAAMAFNPAARSAMHALADMGFVHGFLAGNALAAHDLEAAVLADSTPHKVGGGFYGHLDTLNRIRACGSIAAYVKQQDIRRGIIAGLISNDIPYVLTGSIRDDGPLPEIYTDAGEGAAAMRQILKKATTVICLATQLHTVAAGNILPTFRVVDSIIRPLYIYTVDISEYAAGLLGPRSATIVANVHDFVVQLAHRLSAPHQPTPSLALHQP